MTQQTTSRRHMLGLLSTGVVGLASSGVFGLLRLASERTLPTKRVYYQKPGEYYLESHTFADRVEYHMIWADGRDEIIATFDLT